MVARPGSRGGARHPAVRRLAGRRLAVVPPAVGRLVLVPRAVGRLVLVPPAVGRLALVPPAVGRLALVAAGTGASPNADTTEAETGGGGTGATESALSADAGTARPTARMRPDALYAAAVRKLPACMPITMASRCYGSVRCYPWLLTSASRMALKSLHREPPQATLTAWRFPETRFTCKFREGTAIPAICGVAMPLVTTSRRVRSA